MSDGPITDEAAGTAETPKDFGTDDAGVVARYLNQINIYDRAVREWHDTVTKIFNRYRNKGVNSDARDENAYAGKRYSLLWSSIQTEQPALFTNIPVPMVERRWKDNEDITAEITAEILERALIYTLDQAEFKPAIESSVFDFLMAGRGQIWLRKEVKYGDVIPDPDADANDQGDQTNGDDQAPAQVRDVAEETLCIDGVAWCDFGHNLGRNWKEVYLVWRRLYMDRQQLIARFGAEIGNKVELDYTPAASQNPNRNEDQPPSLYKLATVYELCDKTTKEFIWIALGYKDAPLDRKQNPLGLKDFFPCPRPIYSSTDTTSLIPLPDYVMWKDQAEEVDTITARLHRLIRACQVRGAYDAKFPEIARIFDDGLEMDMIPVDSWSEFAQGGGLDGSLDFVPLTDLINTIGSLYDAREKAKDDAAEISGVADIMRGQNTGPELSATEARISGQYGTLRLQDRQGEIQRFCRDIVRMMGELIAEGFLPETLQAMTGYQLPTAQEKMQAQAVIAQDQAFQQFQQQQQAAQAQQPPAGPPQGGPPQGQPQAQAA